MEDHSLRDEGKLMATLDQLASVGDSYQLKRDSSYNTEKRGGVLNYESK
jgi:hypothetical protein